MQQIDAREGEQFEVCGLVEVVSVNAHRVVLLGTNSIEESEECLRRAARRLRRKIDTAQRNRHNRGSE